MTLQRVRAMIVVALDSPKGLRPMSKVYHYEPWLPVVRLADAWSTQMRADSATLITQLLNAGLNGEFDGIEHDNGERKPGVLVHKETGELIRQGQEYLRLVLRAFPSFEEGVLYLAPRLLVTREAAIAFAERRNLAPPSFWRRTAKGELQPNVPEAELRRFLSTVSGCTRNEQKRRASKHFEPKRIPERTFRAVFSEERRPRGRRPRRDVES
jgi:hypothetical protein